MKITIYSRLCLTPIVIRKDKQRYIVEDTNTGEFYEMPTICIDAIKMIKNGESLSKVEQELMKTYPHEEVNLLDFAQQLLDFHLVAEIDGVKVHLTKKRKEELGFLWINPKFGSLFFNHIARYFYLVLFGIIILLFILRPSLLPQYKDLFVFDLMVLNIPTWVAISAVLMLVHELGHILAMRFHNLPTKLEVGNRLFLVVLETDMSSAWKLPSKERNVLYFAGLCFDTTVLFLALISQIVFENGSETFLGILKVMVLDIVIRVIYQCCIYMKTDLYFVFENVTGCYNLMESAQDVIKSIFSMKKSSTNSSVMYENERSIINVYAIFYFLGVCLTISLFVFYYIPQLLFALQKVLPGFLKGPSTLPFWDAMLFSLQILIGIGLLLYSLRKNYIHHH
ncbi:hypothetical protein [Neobacillus muris]|uniref:hypothetical protein n=1 Tax=Neobacillus muris TaxID=2941334 RepID=UPI00203AF273|nr:hypothetical protein [Neobacillus muris]